MNLFDCETIHITEIYSVEKIQRIRKNVKHQRIRNIFQDLWTRPMKLYFIYPAYKKSISEKHTNTLWKITEDPISTTRSFAVPQDLDMHISANYSKRHLKCHRWSLWQRCGLTTPKNCLSQTVGQFRKLQKLTDGFSNTYYFPNVFKKQTGFSPSQYPVDDI